MSYRHILLAVDFSPEGRHVVHSAMELAAKFKARLSVVHVVDYFPVEPNTEMALPVQFDVEQVLMDAARSNMTALLKEFALTDAAHWIELGSPKGEIVRIAEREGVDLIVLGSHGRHGLGLILGSTANGVLHHAKCDVLAVRVQSQK